LSVLVALKRAVCPTFIFEDTRLSWEEFSLLGVDSELLEEIQAEYKRELEEVLVEYRRRLEEILMIYSMMMISTTVILAMQIFPAVILAMVMRIPTRCRYWSTAPCSPAGAEFLGLS